MPRLDAFQLSDMTRLGIAIRGVAPNARCMEDVAIQLVRLLRSELLDEKSAPVCPLVRLYLTLRYDETRRSRIHDRISGGRRSWC